MISKCFKSIVSAISVLARVRLTLGSLLYRLTNAVTVAKNVWFFSAFDLEAAELMRPACGAALRSDKHLDGVIS